MSERALANAGVRFPPPLLFVAGLALAALLDRLRPAPLWHGGGRPVAFLVAAAVLLGAGAVWMAWGLITFRRARTAVIPNRPASSLVTGGPYRFGRNPMYLGMTTAYCGATLWLDSAWAIVMLPIVIDLLHRLVIRREEAYLADAFGAEYERYRGRVGRWLSLSAPPPRAP
ncbi:isoprenylcysteine carboxylmethyltransferase family protein [Longimicrobium sp.]|uniref:methyltransferase family protein n=1 Tax=Longimicrobium sp. TaxID=2029185 RepID=UPI002B859BF3|nr:isoprenylcysteine carboxylmethyltransferase family protein [Longimicrobium sp.]HSU14089.1 isoprenylcysteine carboxylmethyltransferase family protein [Longimicrobium sp.]